MDQKSQASSVTVFGRDDVLSHVTQIVAEQIGMQFEEVKDSDALVEDLGCDSLDIVEIAMELEEHFDLSVPDEFAETKRTVGDVTDGVLDLLASSRTA